MPTLIFRLHEALSYPAFRANQLQGEGVVRVALETGRAAVATQAVLDLAQLHTDFPDHHQRFLEEYPFIEQAAAAAEYV